MVLKYYFDLMSQPSRALYIFLKLTKIPFESCPVALRKGKKVPFIHDDNFKLAESIAIARYLTRAYPVNDHWYPKDSQRQAKMDEFLEWQHLNLRAFCTLYFQIKWLQPMITGKQPTPEQLNKSEDDMVNTLNRFVEYFLKDGPFINGAAKISFSDILAACEIEQLRIASYEPREDRPILKNWIENVRNDCNPYYDEAHKLVNNLVDRAKKDVQAKL
ncbi:hypothetical protein NQ314_010286 [Rhamnusium bicolor]|uniref:Uncharacterized protein n=1 Tax=Rhamnusium bicolor TaxID=1586634 RepID=A0AAV8XT75_9CUCU|nr:hypothetical protein NQ314_010286 [Rhamnusium bicolor]